MDSKTHSFAERIVRELEHIKNALHSLLKVFGAPKHQHNDRVGISQQSGDESVTKSCTDRTGLQSDPSPIHPQSASYESKYSLKWWKSRLEVLTFLLAIPYAIATCIQAYQAIKGTKIADDTLHVTNRAYLSISNLKYDLSRTNTITFQLINMGHLHAKDISVKVYRLAVKATGEAMPEGTTLHSFSDVVEVGENTIAFPDMQAGLPNEVDVVFKKLPPLWIPSKSGEGAIQLVVVGEADYGTGFDDQPRQNFPFCVKTEWEGATDRLAMAPCNVNDYLPTIQTLLTRK